MCEAEEIKDVVEKWGKCPLCDGLGWFQDPLCRDPKVLTLCDLCKCEGKIKIEDGMKVCGKCNGKGILLSRRATPFGIQQFIMKCDRCNGLSIIKNGNDNSI